MDMGYGKQLGAFAEDKIGNIPSNSIKKNFFILSPKVAIE
jgi:hypothetical protein